MNEAVPKPHEPDERSSSAETASGTPRAFAFPDLDTTRLALEAGRVGVWAWDIASNTMQWSSTLDDIHRLPAGGHDDSFAFFLGNIHAEDQPDVLKALQDSKASGKPFHAQYRLALRPDAGERWVEAVATVVSKDGSAVRLVGVCRDVTERQQLLREMRARARQQEAVALLGEKALTEINLQKLFDEIVRTVADILGVEFVKILELVPGEAELLLRAGTGWRPGLVGTAHESSGRHSQAGYALASGRPVIVSDLPKETRFEVPALLSEHGVKSGVSLPIAGRDGRAYGVLGAHTALHRRFDENDVSFLSAIATVIAGAIQRRQLDRRHELMIRELRHRSGNLFAQLLALFSQTAKNSRSIPDLVAKYEARVLALAHAHRLITEGGWNSTSLAGLLRTLLAPYMDRITLAGPDVFLEPDPSFALSTALHELATNATKYGSLSDPRGTLALKWSVARTDQGLTLTFDWRERDGPVPKRTRRPGFGSRLITMVIERQLNGEAHLTYTPEGLDARLIVPLTHERWPGRIAEPSVTARSEAERAGISPDA